MATFRFPPEAGTLLPPLLACLPASYVSCQPPPALLQLLSPILRQRVQLLSGASDAAPRSSWLPLLCWNAEEAARLESVVEAGDFEPHPVSGEIELGEIPPPKYRRRDEETLQSCLEAADLGLQAIYVWCDTSADGSTSGWQLSELRPMSGNYNDAKTWHSSMLEATQEFSNYVDGHHLSDGLPLAPNRDQGTVDQWNSNADEDDDAYWAQYDNTPARTPAVSTSPPLNSSRNPGVPETRARDEYFDRYEQVQPEMDNDDPSIDRSNFGASSLTGHELARFKATSAVATGHSLAQPHVDEPLEAELIHTRPSSSSSLVVAQLESSAANQSEEGPISIAVQQHISTSVKSLYRLAKSAGIDRKEFRRLVQTELNVLSMLDDED